LQEIREGQQEASTQTTDILCMNNEQLWCTIQKELEYIGITAVTFNTNKDFIFEWFRKAIANGAFGE
jgi:hypothetical protein